jgi:hypothetical protein
VSIDVSLHWPPHATVPASQTGLLASPLSTRGPPSTPDELPLLVPEVELLPVAPELVPPEVQVVLPVLDPEPSLDASGTSYW